MNLYQPLNNIINDENIDLLADSYNISKRLKKYFCQFLSVHSVNGIKHTEMHTAESLVFVLCYFEVETGIEELKRPKSPGIDQIPAELIQAGKNIILSLLIKKREKGDVTECSH
jgi:hypothetical protein